jgi:hypothetical protein
VVGIGQAASGTAIPMTVQVYVEGWSPYEVEVEWVVESGDASGLSDWIPVQVDPEDLQRVAIDRVRVRDRRDASGPDTIARLERLGALRDSGVLTRDEFERQKVRILSEG